LLPARGPLRLRPVTQLDDSTTIRHDPAPAEPATSIRYVVLAFMGCLAFVLYLDRICIGQAETAICAELGLSHTNMTFVFMAFTLAYGLFEVPTGHWGDRYGSRGVLTRIVLWWSAFTALTGAGTGLAMLIVIRFLFGAGEAGAYPNTARVLARWFPDHERGIAQGVVLTCALAGGAVSPPLAAYLIESIGWRWAFVVFGGVGVVWAAAFYYWFRDAPAEHPAVNQAERRYIARGTQSRSAGEEHPRIPWRLVLTSRNVWLLGTIQSCGAFAAYLFFFWYPTYMKQGRGLDEIASGFASSLPLVGGAIGTIGGGFFANWIVRHSRNRARAQRLYGCVVMLIAAVLMLASIHVDWPFGSALCTGAGCMCFLSQQATWWAVVTQISGRHLGALFGLMNSMGVPGAMLSQYLPGAMADWRESLGYAGRDQWDLIFYIYAAVLAIGAFCWLFLQPGQSAVEERE
jgi:ACS family glucarate transporter-like MFS transporter